MKQTLIILQTRMEAPITLLQQDRKTVMVCKLGIYVSLRAFPVLSRLISGLLRAL